MIRKQENLEAKQDTWKAGALAIGVHVVLLAAMLISFNWKAAHPIETITEVALWDKLPAQKVADVSTLEPKPKPVVEEKPEPKPEPKPIVEEKPKQEQPKVDIEFEKKKRDLEQKQKNEVIKKEKVLEQKQFDEQRKKDAFEKLKNEARDEELKDKKAAEKANKDALKKAQQEFLNEEKGNDDKLASAANAGIIKEFTDKMANKIRGKITSGVCGEGNPVLKVNIDILPTGQIRGSARVTKSSGNPTCDDAVERAILASEPFQLPEDSKLKAQFRDMILIFKPND